MLATGGAAPRPPPRARASASWQDGTPSALAALDVPVIQAVCATTSRAALGGSPTPGLTPLDAATQVAIPEFDGRLARRA